MPTSDPSFAAYTPDAAGRGDMADRVRAFDWSRTPLGPMSDWSQGLRTAAGTVLGSPVPMALWWGPSLTLVYNDAYARLLGRKHPDALGRPGRDVWAEVWSKLGPLAEAALHRGETVARERDHFVLERAGTPEDAWFTWSYSPVPDEAGAVGGLLNVAHEETGRVRAERECDRLRREQRGLLAALEHERAKLAEIIARAPAFIAVLRGPDHVFEVANERYYEIVGRRDVIGRPVREALPEVAGQGFFELLDGVYRTGETFVGGEMPVLLSRSGNGGVLDRRHMDLVYQPLREAGGAVSGVFVHGVDVTDAVAAREAARASEARFRTLVANLPDYAIFMIDADGFVTDWFEGAERVKGYRPEEVVGQHVSVFYPPEHVAAGLVGQELREAAETGRAEREDWRVRKGGERFWGNEIMTAIPDAAGRVVGFTKITRDLTERKRADDALREAEERHRTIVENARDYAIFMVDPRGRVVTWNTGAERIFGYAEPEIVGREFAALFTPEDVAAGEHQKELATAAAEGRASDDRWQVRRGGERFFASGITTPLRGADGALRGFVKVCRDLTEQRQVAEQRERLFEREKVARLEAERAMTMRDEFLAVVSHELRTPLSAVLVWSKLLRNGAIPEAERARALESIEAGAEAQRQLVEDLLDVSRMISGKMQIRVADVELAPLVRAAADAVRPMADAKGVEVDAAAADDDALDGGAGRVRADAARVRQVVWNLLNNAVKFTDPGGRVRVGLRRLDDGRVEIRVADTGRGIAPEFLPFVFDRFRQADASTTREHGGLGLGLAISRQLVELHGGSIRAESAGAGQGATFTVELPLGDPGGGAGAARPAGGQGARPARPAPSASALAGARVLVVEDDGLTRAAVQRLLECSGADVSAVGSAAQAVATFREALSSGGRRFDAVVSDVGMPVQDGYELMVELRGLERQRGETRPTPAVALTGFAREEDGAKALAAGFQSHVAKPVEPGQLVATVAGLIGRTA